MKRSDRLSDILAWIYPVLLIVPNIGLAITGRDAVVSKITDIALPLGVYWLIMALSSKVGHTILLTLPIAVLAAFQIVLLYLYGEAIIAVDMFLNVVTTNSKEVTELLGNLLIAIFTVVVIYLPPLVCAVIVLCRGNRASRSALHTVRHAGAACSAFGLVMLIVSFVAVPDYSVRRDIFPVNVIANMVEAVNRTIDTSRYHDSSAAYSFGPVPSHPRGMPEVYVLVIGETSRADNWQLYGYPRPTNPRLSQRDDIVVFDKVLSESNTTHKSVPMLLSSVTAATFADSIYMVKGICDAFNEAGFNTAFFSNQQRNRSFIDFFAYQAQTTEFIRDSHPGALDSELVSHLDEFIDRSPADKIFVVLHGYGSHFNYRERYDDANRRFTPDDATEASADNRPQLINAYDNTIIFTDAMLDRLIASLDSLDVPAVMMYTSDHGEDIFDDSRGRFLHASPTTTFTQIHVPFIVWASEEYCRAFPDGMDALRANSRSDVSSTRSLFPAMMTLAGLRSGTVDSLADVASAGYAPPTRLYLNDYNEAVGLRKAGFRDIDFERADSCHISTK